MTRANKPMIWEKYISPSSATSFTIKKVTEYVQETYYFNATQRHARVKETELVMSRQSERSQEQTFFNIKTYFQTLNNFIHSPIIIKQND